MGLKWLLFSQLPELVCDGYGIQIEDKAILLVICGAHMNNLYIIEVKFVVLIKWSYRSF